MHTNLNTICIKNRGHKVTGHKSHKKGGKNTPFYFFSRKAASPPLFFRRSLIIVCTFAMLLSMAAGVGTDFLANVLSHLANWQNGALAWISSLPHASIENIGINCAQLILIYIVIIALIALAYRISRVIRINRSWHSVTSYY